MHRCRARPPPARAPRRAVPRTARPTRPLCRGRRASADALRGRREEGELSQLSLAECRVPRHHVVAEGAEEAAVMSEPDSRQAPGAEISLTEAARGVTGRTGLARAARL